MHSKWISLVFMVLGSVSLSIESVNFNDISEPMNRIFNVTSNIVEKIDAVSFAENVLLQHEYDFIIVGSGPSGSVLANRLSNGNDSVLLLEAGFSENPIITDLPIGTPNLQLSEYNWNYVTEVQEKACLGMAIFFYFVINFIFPCIS